MGIRFSIDDFGTGYSSLNYLKRLPVNNLKMDQSFVHDLASDPSDKAIAKAVIAMGHGLNLSVIAEGVETEVQRDVLRDYDCDMMQGYLFSKPLPPHKVDTLLKEDRIFSEKTLLLPYVNGQALAFCPSFSSHRLSFFLKTTFKNKSTFSLRNTKKISPTRRIKHLKN